MAHIPSFNDFANNRRFNSMSRDEYYRAVRDGKIQGSPVEKELRRMEDLANGPINGRRYNMQELGQQLRDVRRGINHVPHERPKINHERLIVEEPEIHWYDRIISVILHPYMIPIKITKSIFQMIKPDKSIKKEYELNTDSYDK